MRGGEAPLASDTLWWGDAHVTRCGGGMHMWHVRRLGVGGQYRHGSGQHMCSSVYIYVHCLMVGLPATCHHRDLTSVSLRRHKCTSAPQCRNDLRLMLVH